MKTAKHLTAKETRELIDSVQALLWLDMDAEGEFWNPDKDLDEYNIKELKLRFTEAGLAPKVSERDQSG